MARATDQDTKYSIKPFDPNTHDRTAFSCGYDPIDNFFRFSARGQQKGNFVRIYVALEEGAGSVAGFYAINSHSFSAGDLPKRFQKALPRHGAVPSIYIAACAVDVKTKGQGLGTLLIVDALKLIGRLSLELGVYAAVVDVLDDGNEKSTERFL